MHPHAKHPLSSAPYLALLATLAVFAVIPDASARSSDRNQPMDIGAGKQQGSFDESTPTILSGGVTITQGTLDVAAARAVINSRAGAIARVVLTGGPARLKQQLDDGTPMNAAASTIDYNLVTEVVTFTGNVRIQQPRGTLSGERVVYNMATGEVTSGGEGGGRVQMRIMPKNGTALPEPSGEGG
ncbi:MAG: lipopolysaccharide transport periplasmic protein LptA [Pseudomonadota bacterium]|nr:lipopolysaccharide transport periplasmic protein LptA [Pseudomonadota bacterium]